MRAHAHSHHAGREVAPLVLALLRGGRLPEMTASEARRLAEGLRRSGLTSLVLERVAENGAPSGLIARLEEDRQSDRVDLALLYHRLARFADSMQAAGVRFIVLKGAALAPLLYESVDRRPMVDVDVLIRLSDWPRVKEALTADGYRIPGEQEAAYWLGNYFNMTLASPGKPISSFDLHWSLGQPVRYEVDDAGLWERAVPYAVEGRSLLRLSDEDFLLALILHLGYHYFDARLLWLHDIHLLIRRRPIDWEVAARRARRWKMATVFASGLAYVEKVFPGTVPSEVLRAARPGAIHRLLLTPLRSPAPDRFFRSDHVRLAQLVQGLLIMDSAADALRFAGDKIGRRLRFLGRRPRLR